MRQEYLPHTTNEHFVPACKRASYPVILLHFAAKEQTKKDSTAGPAPSPRRVAERMIAEGTAILVKTKPALAGKQTQV